METITYEGRSIEVDLLAELDYRYLFRWGCLRDCVFLDPSYLPANVKSIVDFFSFIKPGTSFELQNGGQIFGFAEKNTEVRGIRTEKSLYVLYDQEVVAYREDEVIYIAIQDQDSYMKANALLRQGFLEAGSGAFTINHYCYLELVLPIFSRMIGFIEPKCQISEGYIAAHGDKCYQYRSAWEEVGIPFNRGALLFLLTYTVIMDMEKHLSCEWVIKNYGRFKSILNVIEKSVGITDYLEEIQNVELLQPLDESDGETEP